MNRTVYQRIILVALGLLLTIGVLAIFISIGRILFGTNDSRSAPTSDIGRSALLTNAENMSVELTIRGPIVADEHFTTTTMQISSRSRRVTRFSGYSMHVAEQIELPNTYRAYSEFIHALDRAGFMNGQASADPHASTGICATGQLFELRVKRGNQTIKELWSTSCRADRGTLRAEFAPIHQLFTAQIPDSSRLFAGN